MLKKLLIFLGAQPCYAAATQSAFVSFFFGILTAEYGAYQGGFLLHQCDTFSAACAYMAKVWWGAANLVIVPTAYRAVQGFREGRATKAAQTAGALAVPVTITDDSLVQSPAYVAEHAETPVISPVPRKSGPRD